MGRAVPSQSRSSPALRASGYERPSRWIGCGREGSGMSAWQRIPRSLALRSTAEIPGRPSPTLGGRRAISRTLGRGWWRACGEFAPRPLPHSPIGIVADVARGSRAPGICGMRRSIPLGWSRSAIRMPTRYVGLLAATPPLLRIWRTLLARVRANPPPEGGRIRARPQTYSRRSADFSQPPVRSSPRGCPRPRHQCSGSRL